MSTTLLNQELNRRELSIGVVNSIWIKSGFSLTELTGLTFQDLVSTAESLLVWVEQTWDQGKGSAKESWLKARLRNRMIDLIRDNNAISRTQYGRLQKIWRRQSELGGTDIPLEIVRESLINDPEAKMNAQKFDAAHCKE